MASDKTTMSGRRAFTIVEMLVAIAIIGLLLALIMPAVQQSRETARRMECADHLRQFGIGIQSFESAHRYFPSGCDSRFRAPHAARRTSSVS